MKSSEIETTRRNMVVLVVSGALLFGGLAGCGDAGRAANDTTDETAAPVVRSGAEVLAEREFDLLQGRRVGLIVNHTAVVDSIHLMDLIHQSPETELTALFGPEHGIRGTADAGEEVEHGRDVRTGAPIYSLYGQTRKPSPEMLRDVDVLVFDIQDIGARFYTYISTMGLAMLAAAEQGIPFVVLDRPNPIGGEYVSGFMLDPAHESFVGQYEIPMAHGLTVGELARMIKGEDLMEGLSDLDLTVVPTDGWTRDVLWPETNLPWIPPSPNIPDFETALVYPGAVLFEATSASEGRGTQSPFLQLGANWADGPALAETLNNRDLRGVKFEAVEFTPESIEGMAANPKLLGTPVQGVRYVVTDPDVFEPVEAGIHVLHAFFHQAHEAGIDDFIDRPAALARLSGTDRLLQMLRAGDAPEEIIAAWQDEVEAYRQAREAYLLYRSAALGPVSIGSARTCIDRQRSGRMDRQLSRPSDLPRRWAFGRAARRSPRRPRPASRATPQSPR